MYFRFCSGNVWWTLLWRNHHSCLLWSDYCEELMCGLRILKSAPSILHVSAHGYVCAVEVTKVTLRGPNQFGLLIRNLRQCVTLTRKQYDVLIDNTVWLTLGRMYSHNCVLERCAVKRQHHLPKNPNQQNNNPKIFSWHWGCTMRCH